MRIPSFAAWSTVVLAILLIPGDALFSQGGRGPGHGPSRHSGRPATSSPNLSRPSAGPRPSQRHESARPQQIQPQRPAGNRPAGGMHPSSQRPSTQRPSTWPPSVQRPSTRPVRPTTPSQPAVTNRPGQGRPDITAQRPGGFDRPRPSRPSTSVPHLPDGGFTRPSSRPDQTRPGGRPEARPGELGDFLGLDRPVRPGTGPGSRPGSRPDVRPEIRPGRPETRPTYPGGGIAGRPDRPSRPETRPSRPVDPGRPGGGRPGQRPDWAQHRPSGRPPGSMHHRPDWVHLSQDRNRHIHDRWTGVTHHHRPDFSRRWSRDRQAYWYGWGNGVRHNWYHHHHHNYFNDAWWGRHYHPLGGWHYSYRFHAHPWNYWWGRPTWPVMQTWFVWGPTSTTVWADPVQYDYGRSGNIYIQNDQVYLGGQEISSAEEFAMSAAELATVSAPASEAEAEAADWLPLGTFALSTGEKDVDPTRIVQLAANREGIISGTMYNTLTDVSQTIQGKIDPETQRVAFRIGESETVIAETGLYNLTQDEVPLWVHFGPLETETYLLVRLDQNSEEDDYR